MFCTYLTIYSGNLMPPFYVGWTSITKIENGYNGSVSSKEYKEIWKQERKHNPNLFKTIIISKHELKIDAKEKEYTLLKRLKVHKNSLYINKAIQGKNFTYDRTGLKFSEETLKKLRNRKPVKHTQETKDKISNKHKGKILSDHTKSLIGSYHKGKIESDSTRLKKSNSHIGLKHSDETRMKISQNSGRAVSIEINGIKYASKKEAAISLFPEKSFKTALRQINKLL